ncbi:MAG: hypothetical protein IJ364_08880 [Oscillospiraceae bacterium]|nr:hypothetical protein [Oscillospiraceae bacterium]
MGYDFNSPYWERKRAEAADENVDWKKMYLHLAAATADAIELLQKAQLDCEEMFISAEENGEFKNS